MNSLFRPLPSRFVFPLLTIISFSLTLVFLVLRLSTPSDGARLALGETVASMESLSVFPLVERPGGLQAGDHVTAVNGEDVRDWTNAIFSSTAPSAGWRFGDRVDYTVLRNGRATHVFVTLGLLQVGNLIRQNALVGLLLVLMQIEAIWIWWQRRGETATQALLLGASAFIAFSLCWYVGMDLAAMMNVRGLVLFYRMATFTQLMLMSGALIHFAIALAGAGMGAQYSWKFLALIYLTPYPAYLGYLWLTYTPDTFAWLRLWQSGMIALIFLAFLLTILALVSGYSRITVPSLRPRVRIAATGIMAAILIAILVGVAPALLTGEFTLGWQALPLLAVPVMLGLAIAVVFYGLFDIRVAIQRTLVWGTLTALIVMAYGLIVGLLSAVFQTQGSPTFSLIATGIVAILFSPVQMRLQRSVNWLLYGERDTPNQVIARLSHRLEETLAPDDALAQIVNTVAVALKLPYAAVELCHEEDYVRLASWGQEGEATITYPLIYSGEKVGRLVVAPRSPGEALTSGDHQLLTGLLYHAESVIQTARLTADLQRSRENLVITREEERRRIRRDLHDGLGPSLASLTLQIDATRNLLKGGSVQVESLLLDMKSQIYDALGNIRSLIDELRPPALDQLGLTATLSEKARELERASGLRISVETPPTMPPLSAAVEVALYRICLEAMTNVIRHSGATFCTVRLTCNQVAQLEVSDNGRGLPEGFRRGVGLNSMMERASELGGSCLFERGDDGGTRVTAQLPRTQLPS